MTYAKTDMPDAEMAAFELRPEARKYFAGDDE